MKAEQGIVVGGHIVVRNILSALMLDLALAGNHDAVHRAPGVHKFGPSLEADVDVL